MRYWFLSVTVLIGQTLFAQIEVLSKIPMAGNSLGTFMPQGYVGLAMERGDLNKDKKEDCVLVFEAFQDSLTKYDPDSIPPRILVVLFKKDSGWVVAVKTDKAIMCKDCGGVYGDPFNDIYIENGILVIDHYGGSAWRWSYSHKFRYQQNKFCLIGKTSLSYWNVSNCEKLGEFAGTEYKDVNLVTGAYEEKKVSREGCKLLLNKKGKTKPKALVTLNSFNIENQL